MAEPKQPAPRINTAISHKLTLQVTPQGTIERLILGLFNVLRTA